MTLPDSDRSLTPPFSPSTCTSQTAQHRRSPLAARPSYVCPALGFVFEDGEDDTAVVGTTTEEAHQHVSRVAAAANQNLPLDLCC